MRRVVILIVILVILLSLTVEAQAQPGETRAKDILKTVSPSVVKVIADSYKLYFATGIAVEADHVISTLEVLRYPYRRIYVQTAAGMEIPAKVVGKDRITSLVLLKIQKKALTPIKRAGSPEVGDPAALVGAFYKRFPSIYKGIVSSVSDEELILNAPVTPGLSGGAVVNEKGELIGIVRGRFGFAFSSDYVYKDQSGEFVVRSPRSRTHDLCLAVPTVKLMSIAGDLKKHGQIRRGWVGIRLTEASEFSTPTVDAVTPGSPAEKAGFRPGDRILKIRDTAVRNRRDVSLLVKGLKPGQKATFDISRDNLRKSVLVLVGEAAPNAVHWEVTSPRPSRGGVPGVGGQLPGVENYVFEMSTSRSLGMDVLSLTAELANKFKVAGGKGLMVSRVLKNTSASKAGIRPGDVMVRANGRSLRQLADLRRVLNGLRDNEAVTVVLYRDGKSRSLQVVPDKGRQQFGSVFDKFKNALHKFQVTVDSENRMRGGRDQQGPVKRKGLAGMPVKEQPRTSTGDKKMAEYEEKIRRMMKEQQQLKEEMEQMRKLLEKEKAEKAREQENKQGSRI